MEQKQDFRQEFTTQRKKLRPWAILLLVLITFLLIVTPILFFVIELDKNLFTGYLTIFVILSLFILAKVVKLSKCPSCKKYMGRDIGKSCSNCDVKIQE